MVKTRRPRPKWVIRERSKFAAEIRHYRWIIRHGDVVNSVEDFLVWRTRISAVQYLVRRFGHRISTRIIGPLYTTRFPVTGKYHYSFPTKTARDWTGDYKKSKGE